MKKKILTAMIAAALLAMLTACGSSTDSSTDNSDKTADNAAQATTQQNDTNKTEEKNESEKQAPDTSSTDKPSEDAQSTNPLMSAELNVHDVMNGYKTEKIGGQYAYIEIPKAVLKNITEEQFAEFCQKRVADSGYNWVSIICGDGTGICFSGSLSIMATYGEVDSDGAILNGYGDISYVDESGNIVAENGHYTYEARSSS